MDYLSQFPSLPKCSDTVVVQLRDLQMIANRLGMFEAADAIQQLFNLDPIEALEYGCHLDLEITTTGEPDECVLDLAEYGHTDCIYAKEGMRKEQCLYWRVK